MRGPVALAMAALIVAQARPSAAEEAPPLTPAEAVGLSIGTTVGLVGTGVLTGAYLDPTLGLSLVLLSDFAPEMVYVGIGHAGDGAAMWALRQLVALAGAGVGFGIAYAALGEPECESGCDGLEGLGYAVALLAGVAIGGGVANLGFLVYEWCDLADTVGADWAEYESASGRSPPVVTLDAAPFVAPDDRGGFVGGLGLAGRF
jgi:hypothetical protein